MVYRQDTDLEFLQNCDNSDLDILVKYLTTDKSGDERWNCDLPSEPRYKQHNPKHTLYWDLIAAEFQTYGSNFFTTQIFRGGKGMLYRDILIDVAKRLKVNFNDESKTEVIEMNLLMKVLTDAVNKMSIEELREMVENLNIKPNNMTSEGVVAALQVAIKLGGFAPYKLAVIIANAVAKQLIGKGLTFAANATLTKTISIFAGPIGWVLNGLWLIFDLAGPAYRITIPCVIQIAYMRAKLIYSNK